MFDLAHVLAYAAILTWLMIMTAAGLGSKLWTPAGLKHGMGNRETPAELSGLAGRADRAAKNMLENLILFTALAAAVTFAGSTSPLITTGANVFLWARVAYWFIYLAGIPGIRTAVWGVSVAGMVMMAISM
jgi:uncharacterized MAPEG superfamily protein